MAEPIQVFLQSFDKVKQTEPNQYICRCPVHPDKKASLSIGYNPNEDKIALHCHAGCDTRDILTMVGKTMADLMPGREPEKPKKLEKWQVNLVDEYRYEDAKGNYLYSKLRYEGEGIDGKKIRYGRIVDGKYTSGKGDQDGELYNLPAMLRAIEQGKTIYYVEGEKDVKSLKDLGLTAVTAGGTADWRSDFARYFIGAHDVVILADKDDPGEQLAEKVSKDLRAIVYRQRIVTPSGDRHGDVTDYLKYERGSREGLLKMVNEADNIYANWVIENKKSGAVKINPSLLADAVLKYQHVLVAMNPGIKSDQVLWYRHGVYSVLSDREVDIEVDRFLPNYISNPSLLRNTTQMIMVRAKRVGYDALDDDERYINVRNGLIKVPEFKLVDHTPDLLSTVQLRCNYDPKATAPHWEKFKHEYCQDEDGNFDEEMYRLDRMKAGLILSSIHGHTLKKAFVQYSSEGNTGKSVDIDTWNEMLGPSNVAEVDFNDMATDRWAKGRCWGKRLIAVGDQGRETIQNSDTFKKLTGGDPVSAELKGLQHFTYTFGGVILVSCNHLPVFSDDKGNHMAERLVFLHSRNIITEDKRDMRLRKKIKGELDGVLNWALAGLKDFFDNGEKLSTCKSSDMLMDEYRQRYDTFYAFLRECCIVTGNKSDYVIKSKLEDEYETFCYNNELTAAIKRNIKTVAAAHGIPLKRTSNNNVYRGVRLKSDLEEIDEKDIAGTGFVTEQETFPF